MANLSWIGEVANLSPAALTVRAQTISPNDNGRLLWDIFFPRQDVNSVDLADVTTLDYRPTADRREWNARGRNVPLKTPTRREVSIVPIEANHKIDEKEMQKLSERALGNEAIIREVIGTSIPARVDTLVEADYRRLEVDAFNAWALGTIVQRNPEDASKTVTASFGFSGSRYTTAGTAWNDSGVNAYDLFLTWYAAGIDLIGPADGAMLRLATLNAILADAPTLTAGSVKMTRADLERDIQDRTGSNFRFVLNENSVDIFDDGGTAHTRTKIWPSQRVALIPAGNVVGRAAFAPVVHAMEIAAQVPGAGVDIRGATVYYEHENGGRELVIEAQMNALPVPDEQLCYVINAGV